jgi:hypothetical protein
MTVTNMSGAKINPRFATRRHEGGWTRAAVASRRPLLLQLGRVDLDLVPLVVDVDVLVLVTAALRPPASLLARRHRDLA